MRNIIQCVRILNKSFISILPFVALLFKFAIAIKPELVIQTGHCDNIECITFSPDGKLVATGSQDNMVKIWDTKTMKEVHILTGHSGHDVYSVAFSPNGKILATGGMGSIIKLWNTNTWNEIMTLDGTSYNYYLTFSPDGNILAASNERGYNMKLWDVHTGKFIYNFKTSVGHYYSDNMLFMDVNDTLKFLNPYSGKVIMQYKVRTRVRDDYMDFCPKNKLFASADNMIKFDPSGKYIATMLYPPRCNKDTVKIWDFSDLKKINGKKREIEGGLAPKLKLYYLEGYPDYEENFVQIWDIEKRIIIHELPIGSRAHDYALAYSPDGKILATAGKGVDFWNTKSGEKIDSLRMHNIHSATRLAFNPNGSLLSSGTEEGLIRLWNISGGKVLRTLSWGKGIVKSLSFTSDGNKLGATYGRSREPLAPFVLWDLKINKPFYTLYTLGEIGNKYDIKSAYITENGKKIVTSGRNIKIWDLLKGSVEKKIFKKYNIFAFPSPDGKLIASISGDLKDSIFIIDALSGEVVKCWKNLKNCNIIEFNKDGSLLAVAGENNTLQFRDVKTWKVIQVIKGDSTDDFSVFKLGPNWNTLATKGGLYKKKCTNWSRKYQKYRTYYSDIQKYEIKLWDVSSSKITYVLKEENRMAQLPTNSYDRGVESICFSPDGKLVASAGRGRLTYLWNVKTGEQVASFIPVDSEEYVIATPDNYYTASKGALEGVAFRIGNGAYPFEVFDLKLNRPDIILSRMGSASKKLLDLYYAAYRKRLDKMNFTEDMLADDFNIPEIYITTKNLPLSTKSKSLKFKVLAKDSKYILDRLNVYVNNVPIHGKNGIDLRKRNTSNYEDDIYVELSNGTNKIQVSVLNAGGIESLKETFKITYIGPHSQPDLYLVVVGVSNYLNKNFNLRYASKDANDIADIFEKKKINFGNVNIIRILDSKATRDNIQNAKDFLQTSKVDDMAILFLAGHGVLNNNLDFYFGTTDMDFNNPSSKGLSFDEIEELLDNIPARKKILFMDACHSGEVEKENFAFAYKQEIKSGIIKARAIRGFKTIKKRSSNVNLLYASELMRELFVDLRRGSGAVVISSASGFEFAFESPNWKNGVFTFSIIDGLKSMKTDTDKDGKVLVSELRNYVAERVQKLTNGKQTPTSRRENLESDFIVY